MRSGAVWGLSGCRAQTRGPHRAGLLGLLEEQESWGALVSHSDSAPTLGHSGVKAPRISLINIALVGPQVPGRDWSWGPPVCGVSVRDWGLMCLRGANLRLLH